ncbi:helix-turn-helix domain-containing protein [Muricauda sp. TY007]|uniref:helix-turn-helix domain-containing protein n=1 Tax=Allomuricauda sp. TY007 TaxID=2683200 RepID=UPI0013BF0911|nr:helix-turn-helix transcriptional regulator [Muricauda sp. TY007]NDV15567.1 helix-turn-helix domain-containing protein [Muricauda sp. TY007]
MIRVKEILKEKGRTQIELAEKLKMSPVGLSKLINGNPTLETMQKIADALDVEVKDLFSSKAGDSEPFGFVQYQNVIHKISSMDELKNLIDKQ